MTDEPQAARPESPASRDERTPEEILAEEDERDPDVGVDGTGVGELP